MTYRIGIIAEDNSDVDVLYELIGKIAQSKGFVIRKFAANGCGRILGKCCQWAHQLSRQGCTLLVIVHDLDARVLAEFRPKIEQACRPSPIEKHVVIIPVREIEAWLLSDSQAIQKALNLKQKVPHIGDPEALLDPKKMLGETIYLKSAKTKRYVVNDNQRIARKVELKNIRRCSSFLPLEKFIRAYIV